MRNTRYSFRNKISSYNFYSSVSFLAESQWDFLATGGLIFINFQTFVRIKIVEIVVSIRCNSRVDFSFLILYEINIMIRIRICPEFILNNTLSSSLHKLHCFYYPDVLCLPDILGNFISSVKGRLKNIKKFTMKYNNNTIIIILLCYIRN